VTHDADPNELTLRAERDVLRAKVAELRGYAHHAPACRGDLPIIAERRRIPRSEYMELTPSEKRILSFAGVVLEVYGDDDNDPTRWQFSTGSAMYGDCTCGLTALLADDWMPK